jgi:serine/threonine-protein kinase HipA
MADEAIIEVYYEARTVGRIEVHPDGPTFTYDPRWISTRGAFPISALMPLSSNRVMPDLFLPWAANLLPEAAQLQAVGRILGASPGDVVGILKEIGRDTAGALSIGQPGTTSAKEWRRIPDDASLERIIDELPSKPFLVGEDGVSMSLAGVQTKLGVAIGADGGVSIPVNGAPSTHILKPDSEGLFGGVHNEALCLLLARQCGLNAPTVSTGKAGARTYLLVRRYDRFEQAGHWRRLHQEDFCQALGRPPSAKYEVNQSGIRGPTLADIFTVIRNIASAADVLSMLDYVIFNILVCNVDAHAKNYSLLISGRGFQLAPIYDVMCGAAWPNVTRNLAQKIAGKNRGEHLKRRHWERFAAESGLNATRTVARVEALAMLVRDKVRSAAAEVEAMPAGPHSMMGPFCEAVEERVRAVLGGLADVSGSSLERRQTTPHPRKKKSGIAGASSARSRRKRADVTPSSS